MTKLLEKALRQVKTPSDDRQNDLSEIILYVVEHDVSGLQISDEQVREVEGRLADPRMPVFYCDVMAYFNTRV